MMENLATYWSERSTREQWMLGVMFALLAIVILWFGIALPLDRAQRDARAALVEATDRNAAIRAAADQLKALPRNPAGGGSGVPLDQYVGQSAGEAGLTLERAQAKVEGRNFDIRKQLLKFDDVMNEQRKVIFGQRREIMEADNLNEIVTDMREQVIDDLIDTYMPPKTYADQWDTQGFYAAVIEQLNVDVPIIAWCEEDGVDDEVIRERLMQSTDELMAKKAEAFGEENMRNIEKQLLLQAIDTKWRDHLLTLEHLRSVVGFRSYAQRDPLNEYKNEAFQLFETMLDSLRQDVTQKLGQIQPMSEEQRREMMQEMATRQAAMQAAATEAADEASEQAEAAAPGFDENDPSTWGNPGRNDPCPCGSGKKFKHCHGQIT